MFLGAKISNPVLFLTEDSELIDWANKFDDDGTGLNNYF